MNTELEDILAEDESRRKRNAAPFDPVSGLNSTGPRRPLEVEGMPGLWLPESMFNEPMMAELSKSGSLKKFLSTRPQLSEKDFQQRFERLRCLHDFPYWAARYAYIKRKGGGEDVLFTLNRPQRRLVELFESMRVAGEPIRVILLKARQWGGSTCVQIYMAWLQLIHRIGLNSLIIAHQSAATEEIRDMFDRMIERYPAELLTEPGEKPDPQAKKTAHVGRSGAAIRLLARKCKIKVGTAERPDSCRGGDYNLVHLSEVGIWKKTLGKSPDDMVRSACSGILFEPLTMIVYESTANGTGNFFHREYEAARRGESQFRPLFISWYEIDQYTLPPADRRTFAAELLKMRTQEDSTSERREPGRYLWMLWQRGATLDAINWYVHERTKYNDHGMMASEYPTDDVEAFVHSGARVFDRYKVEALRHDCCKPGWRGEVSGEGDWGERALKKLAFHEDACGNLAIWCKPDTKGRTVSDRYVAVVDVGGRSLKSDWSVVCVFDRLFMASGGGPEVVAQWRGHCDIDLLAWKAVQIAAFYDNALLVIESNTLETKDRERSVEGDQSNFILNQIREVYPNLYARRQSEEAVKMDFPPAMASIPTPPPSR